MPDLTELYYANNGEKIRRLIDGIIAKLGGIYDDKDDFYSIGNEVFFSVLKSYDPEKSQFETYLYGCIMNRIKTEITKRNALKRSATVESLDKDGCDIDVASNVNIENDVVSEEAANQILKGMSRLGQKIVKLRLKNMTDTEIKKELGISSRVLDRELRKIKVKLTSNAQNTVSATKSTAHNNNANNTNNTERTRMMSIAPDYRDDYLSLDLIKEKIDEGELLINHPNQRNDWAWDRDDISTLIATNLHGFRINPIIVCEEERADKSVLNWVVDGKQRITSMIHFAYHEEYEKPFKVSPKTEYAEIPYQTKVVDENGNIVKDDVGRPVLETKVFDIRNKTFADFPEELQRKFKSYVFTVTRYVNCDSEMISYHIRRYNKGKAMNKIQKANTYLTESNAAMCKKVAHHQFFENMPKFKAKQIREGNSERTVMDAIFTMNYRDNWMKDGNKMYAFYNENGDPSDFALVDEYLTRLNDVIDDEVGELFTTTDAHLFIALFHEFVELGLPDEVFNEFLHAFIDGLKQKEVDGISYDKIGRATRDKSYVVNKMHILESLLDDYTAPKVA